MTGQSSFPTRFLRNSPNRSCADGSKQSSAQRFHVAAITSLKFSHLPRLQHEGPLLALGQGSWHLTRLPDRESPKTQLSLVGLSRSGAMPGGSVKNTAGDRLKRGSGSFCNRRLFAKLASNFRTTRRRMKSFRICPQISTKSSSSSTGDGAASSLLVSSGWKDISQSQTCTR